MSEIYNLPPRLQFSIRHVWCSRFTVQQRTRKCSEGQRIQIWVSMDFESTSFQKNVNFLYFDFVIWNDNIFIWLKKQRRTQGNWWCSSVVEGFPCTRKNKKKSKGIGILSRDSNYLILSAGLFVTGLIRVLCCLLALISLWIYCCSLSFSWKLGCPVPFLHPSFFTSWFSWGVFRMGQRASALTPLSNVIVPWLVYLPVLRRAGGHFQHVVPAHSSNRVSVSLS